MRLFKYEEHFNLIYNQTEEEENNNNTIMKDIVDKIHQYNIKTLANGLLMRSSAFHVWYYYIHKEENENILKENDKFKYLDLYNNIKQEIIKDSSLTHPNEEIPIIASIFALWYNALYLNIHQSK